MPDPRERVADLLREAGIDPYRVSRDNTNADGYDEIQYPITVVDDHLVTRRRTWSITNDQRDRILEAVNDYETNYLIDHPPGGTPSPPTTS